MDESNNLILNFITDDVSIDESTSLRSKLKHIGGSWKDKKKVRKLLKKNSQVHSSQNSSIDRSQSTNTTDESIRENISGPRNFINVQSNNVDTGNHFNSQKSTHSRDNSNSQRNLNSKTQIISSIFSYNPEIPKVTDDDDISTNVRSTTDHKPSNGPINDTYSFISMGLNSDLVENIKNKLGVEKPTNIQRRAIPVLMSSISNNERKEENFDVVVQAETGSGKTLTYLFPIIHQLISITANIQDNKILSRSIGTLAIILTPTRELAIQILSVLEALINIPSSKERHLAHWIVAGSVIGGEKRQSEKARLRKGINILVCTPGRLLDHLQNTKSFLVENLSWLILDEADRLLELGFEETLQSILKILEEKTNGPLKNQLYPFTKFWPNRRQTVLCSATLKDEVKRLAGYALSNPIFIGGKNDDISPLGEKKDEKSLKETTFSTPNQLKQTYVITPAKLRLVTLTAILKSIFKVKRTESFMNHKIIVFMSSCDSVDFHFDLFIKSGRISEELTDDDDDRSISTIAVIPGTKMFRLHGDLSQNVRTKTFNEFSHTDSGILFCTDVAARGLDLPDVAKIIQYDPPTDLKDYVHRVGRTARLGKEGEAILFLLPSEIEYIHVLRSQEIFAEPVQVETLLETLTVSEKRNKEGYEKVAADLQLQFERYVLSNSECTTLAQKAYSSHIRAYATHTTSEKWIFHVKKLHLGHVAKSFGLREAPSNIKNEVVSSPSNKFDNRKNVYKKKNIHNKEGKFTFGNQKDIKKRKFEIMNEFSFGNYEIKPWIKKKILCYLLNEEFNKTPVRAQVLRFTNSREELDQNELVSAEIHDDQHFIKCYFTNESVHDFECKNIPEETEGKSFLNICEEMEIKESLQAQAVKDKKPSPLDHPGWNEFGTMFYSNSIDIHIIPPDQLKIMRNIPGWNFSGKNNDNDASIGEESETESTASTEWNPGSPESSRYDSDGKISLNDEDFAIIIKGNYFNSQQPSAEEVENNNRADTLKYEEVRVAQNKRKNLERDPDDGEPTKKQKNFYDSVVSFKSW
ncbi:7678_t:CDS:2 [Funneliformis geosporum]|uniref:ATP-dependent RNA helicase n=1 Tax=Funneliformis geosporum TaxID=1117311 RepID=A0A9W4WMR2_9GLOM|nr:5303_t:CDS:2 [Funneliformis geosporum]CAI2173590.1 7678_t:CDS:2 [Funneliformis geosporum]